MSFSSELKRELCGIREMQTDEMAAMLFGMFYAGKTLDGRAAIQTESAELAAAAAFLAENVFAGARCETKRLVKSDGSLYTFSIKSQIIKTYGDFSEIAPSIVSGNDADAGAFLRGVFVCCGSITDPNKEYHLEIVLPVPSRTERLRRFIEEHGIAVKLTIRGKTPVLYIKESGVIEDFLTYIGAGNHALEIMRVKIEKDFRNRVNRSVNCDSANLDKTVAASEKSRREIELIGDKIGFDSLKPELRETARLRLENPEASLSELCELFDPPISRSGLNHRLKKLAAIANSLLENSS